MRKTGKKKRKKERKRKTGKKRNDRIKIVVVVEIHYMNVETRAQPTISV